MLDDYENRRMLDRKEISLFARRGRIPVEERVRICLQGGSSGDEIKECVREVRAIQERMLQNIYGASPFDEVQERWNNFTDKINMAGIVAAKKFTKLWRQKTADRKDAAMKAGLKDEITTTSGNTPVKVPGLHASSFSESESEMGDSVKSTTGSYASHGSSSPSYLQCSPSQTKKLPKPILKVTKPAEPVPPPPPPKSPPAQQPPRENSTSTSSVSDIKVDLKQFAKSTVQSLKRASKARLGTQSSGNSDDSSVFSDMEESMDSSNEDRISWSSFSKSKDKEKGKKGEIASGSKKGKKECIIS